MKDWNKGVAFGDTQGVNVMEQCVALFCAWLKDYKPNTVVWLGDIVDWPGASRFVRMEKDPGYLIDEVLLTDEKIVQPVIKAAPKARHIWLEGNHEYRLKDYIAKYAEKLKGWPGLSIQEVFKMKERGIQYIEGRGVTKNGIYRVSENIMVCHGTKTGQMAAKQLAQKWDQGLAIQGHVHKWKEWSEKKGSGRHIAGVTAPCLCREPDFGDGMDDYTRGFVPFMWKDGQYRFEHAEILGSHNNYTDLQSSQGGYKAKLVKGKWTASRV